MAYIKFKELTKYFDFKDEIRFEELPSYTLEYIDKQEQFVLAYKNSKDYVVFTNRRMILFDRDPMAMYYKKIHIIPFISISTSAINFKPEKVELLFSLDSGYQLHVNFIQMDHEKKERLKMAYKLMMTVKI